MFYSFHNNMKQDQMFSAVILELYELLLVIFRQIIFYQLQLIVMQQQVITS